MVVPCLFHAVPISEIPAFSSIFAMYASKKVGKIPGWDRPWNFWCWEICREIGAPLEVHTEARGIRKDGVPGHQNVAGKFQLTQEK